MLNTMIKLFKRKSASRGQSIIEFGLLLPFLLVLVFGITELGRMLMQANMLTQAAREGARAAAVGTDSSSVVTRVTDILTASGIDAGDITVTLTGPDGNNMMQVEATAAFDVIPSEGFANTFLGMPASLTLRGASSMRLEQ